MTRTLTIFGATGSVGVSILDLVTRNADQFEVLALTAHSNVAFLARAAIKSKAKLGARQPFTTRVRNNRAKRRRTPSDMENLL